MGITMTATAVSGSIKDIFHRFVLFAGMGAVGTLVHYLVLMALVEPDVAGPVIATGVVLLWNFTGNLLWTFRREKDHAP